MRFYQEIGLLSQTLQRISVDLVQRWRFSPVSGLPKCNILCFQFVKIPLFVILPKEQKCKVMTMQTFLELLKRYAESYTFDSGDPDNQVSAF